MPVHEETPLLWSGINYTRPSSVDRTLPRQRDGQLNHTDASGQHPHAQFCALTGCPPSNANPKDKVTIPKKSLYGRTVSQLASQRRAYNASAILNNVLLLSQVMLGAALTALGASESSHILITCFGALNTVIAGLIAYLKSRGQPMRARMYRDDLERLVDEIENSEVMWRGISQGVHGYDEIDTDEVTVRSEVARLTRLYERAIRLNGMNNPDMYMAGGGAFDGGGSGGGRANRGGPPAPQAALPAVTMPAVPQPSAENPGPPVPVVENPDDVAPATKATVKDDKNKDQKDKGKDKDKDSTKKPSTEKTSGNNSDTTTDPPSPKPAPATAAEPKSDSPTPKPAPSPPAQPAPAAAPVIPTDPDASPATAARLKPKRTRSDNPKPESGDAKKVAGDDDS